MEAGPVPGLQTGRALGDSRGLLGGASACLSPAVSAVECLSCSADLHVLFLLALPSLVWLPLLSSRTSSRFAHSFSAVSYLRFALLPVSLCVHRSAKSNHSNTVFIGTSGETRALDEYPFFIALFDTTAIGAWSFKHFNNKNLKFFSFLQLIVHIMLLFSRLVVSNSVIP